MSTLESSRSEAASGAPSIASVIDGEARTDAPGGRLTSTNPAQLDEVVAEVALADAATFVDACRAARAAQKEWAKVPAPARGRVIAQVGRLVRVQQGGARPARHARGRQAVSPSRSARSRRSSTPATSSSARAAACTARRCRRRCPTSSCSRSARRSASPRSSRPATSPSPSPPGTSCRRSCAATRSSGSRPSTRRRSATRWRRIFHAGGVPGGVLNLVQADGAATFAGLEQALERGPRRQGRLHRLERGRLQDRRAVRPPHCSRRAWSSAARTRWS